MEGVGEAVGHINTYGSAHTDAIVTEDGEKGAWSRCGCRTFGWCRDLRGKCVCVGVCACVCVGVCACVCVCVCACVCVCVCCDPLPNMICTAPHICVGGAGVCRGENVNAYLKVFEL